MKTVEQLIEERLITGKDGYTESRVSINVIVTIAKLYANQKLDEALSNQYEIEDEVPFKVVDSRFINSLKDKI